MQYRSLGRSGITVSSVCLGTMTFGEQTREDESHRQMDLARDAGVTFIDAADRLCENLDLAEHTTLGPEAIEAIHAENPNPLLK